MLIPAHTNHAHTRSLRNNYKENKPLQKKKKQKKQKEQKKTTSEHTILRECEMGLSGVCSQPTREAGYSKKSHRRYSVRTMLPVLVTARLSQECLRPGQARHGEDRTQPPGVVALACDPSSWEARGAKLSRLWGPFSTPTNPPPPQR